MNQIQICSLLLYIDWASLLEFINQQNLCINILVGEDKSNVFDDLLQFFKRHGVMLSAFVWSLKHYCSQDLDDIATELTKVYHIAYSALGFMDDLFFEISQGYHNLLNKSHLVLNNTQLPYKFADIPVCVVGNGPSLEQDLAFLRKYQDKVIIIACGSAIETLFNEGIKPLFYACTERIPIVGQNLEVIKDSAFLDDVVLLATTVVYPEVVKMFKHQALFGKRNEAFYWLLVNKNCEKFKNIKPATMTNPLVGNMGMAGASLLGFKHIYLFGIDNGTVEEDKLHPNAANFYNKIMTEHESRERKSLSTFAPGNFGQKVKTKMTYQFSASVMGRCASIFQQNHGTTYYNCSNGLKINNIRALHSQDINFDNLPDINRQELLDFIDQQLTTNYSLSATEQRDLVNHEEFYTMVNRILKLIDSVKQANTRQGVAFALQNITEMLGMLVNTNLEYLHKILTGSLNNAFIVYYGLLYLIENEKEAVASVHDSLKYVQYLLEDAKQLYQYVPNYFVVDHRKYLNGKVGFDHSDSKAPLLPEVEVASQEDIANYPHKIFIKRYA